MNKTLLSVTLIAGISVSSHAQIYLRGQLCADFAMSPPATYQFSEHSQQMLSTIPFKAAFGGGAFVQTELGLRMKKIEVGFTYTMHGGSSEIMVDTVFSSRGDSILTTRSALFTSLNRGGVIATYYFGDKKFAPLVFGGVQMLVRPRFTLSFRSDTLEHPNVPTKRYCQTFEYYGGGLGLGASVGAGISFSSDERLRCVIKAGYTFQQWQPRDFIYSRFISSGHEEVNYSALPSPLVKLNTFFVSFGGTYYFGVKEEIVAADPLKQ